MFFISRKIAGELYVSIDQVNKAIEEKNAEIENNMEIEAGDIVAGDFGATIARARINYCPMCGRKLNKQPPAMAKENKNGSM